MAKNSQEPRKFDAVFGEQVPPPVNGAVLGGIEGLRQRFASLSEQVCLETVANASKYGDEGIDILHLSHNKEKADTHNLIPADVWFAGYTQEWGTSYFVTFES